MGCFMEIASAFSRSFVFEKRRPVLLLLFQPPFPMFGMVVETWYQVVQLRMLGDFSIKHLYCFHLCRRCQMRIP